jgi:hypothetical protein
MKKILLAASVAAAVLGAVGSAAAAIMPVVFTAPGPDGSFSGTFGDNGITSATFTDTFTFTLPTGLASTVVTSTLQGASTDVNFTSVTLNGNVFAVGQAGQNEFRFLDNLGVSNGTQTLIVSGTSAGRGSFAGTLAFAPAVRGVPEPASWALMILGFGGVGASLRRRNANKVRFQTA